MSEIKVNSIKGVGASTAAITVNNTDGSCAVNNTQRQGKNLIINGAFLINQRGSTSTSTGYHTVDRYNQEFGGTDESPTFAQVSVVSGTTPYTNGFRKACKITNGNQTSGAGAGDYIYLRTVLEAQDIANSGWNYLSSSSYITISYWVKSSVAQNFYGTLTTGDGTPQAYVWETGTLTADTWTKITKTIPGNSNLTFDNDNGAGMYVDALRGFDGTDRTGSMSLNAWAAYNSSVRTPDQTSTWYTTNDATLEITGLQLEVGSVATDFEHLSFEDDLRKCKRYYQRIAEGNGKSICENATQYNSQYLFMSIPLPVTMRAAPTLEDTNASNHFIKYANGSSSQFNTFGLDGVTTNTLLCISADVSGTGGHSTLVRTNSNNAIVAAVSEL